MKTTTSYLANYKNVSRGDSIISPTLLSFAQEQIDKYKTQSLMELGCDTGDLLNALNVPTKIGVDISEEAIRIAKSKFSQIDFLCFDVTGAWPNFQADLFLDSHLYHSLVFKEERQAYLRQLKAHLNLQGKILIECMGKPDEVSYRHFVMNEAGSIWAETQNQNLYGTWKSGEKIYVPFRSYFTRDREQEIIDLGLKIEMLFYSPYHFEFTNMGELLKAPMVRLILS